jgi:hypothetical protein
MVRNYTFYPHRKCYIFVKTCQTEALFPCAASSGFTMGAHCVLFEVRTESCAAITRFVLQLRS